MKIKGNKISVHRGAKSKGTKIEGSKEPYLKAGKILGDKCISIKPCMLKNFVCLEFSFLKSMHR